MSTKGPEALLDLYDDLAVEIVDETAENTEAELPFSNRELAENICRAMGWEDFDLLAKYDFAEVEKTGQAEAVLAHAFISFLRWRLFRAATERSVGDAQFNQSCTAYSEYWYITLIRRWKSMTTGSPLPSWVN